jgi:hypothetical protein
MNATELRTLQRRIDRTRKLAIGMMRAAQQLNDELATIEAFVRDAQQPVMTDDTARTTMHGRKPARPDEMSEFAKMLAPHLAEFERKLNARMARES